MNFLYYSKLSKTILPVQMIKWAKIDLNYEKTRFFEELIKDLSKMFKITQTLF